MQGYSSPFSASRNIMSPRPGGRPSLGSSKNVGRSLSVRSSQLMQVVFRTPYHVVETFGVPLPVLVTDALTFSERSTAVSVSISADGWAWVVCGRRLLIWEYKQLVNVGSQRHIVNRHCYELTLPRSDLAHKAQLVAVFSSQGSKVPSCIAVSPEGAVRYWPSISHEGVSVEDNADLQGQECDSLTNITPIGCVLATTTSTILLVEPLITGGRHAISCRTLKMPHGWLGGIGCKVSSLIFGSLPTSQVTETKLAKVAAVSIREGRTGGWCVYVLAEHSLQKWTLYPGEVEKLVYECDINRIVRDAFCDTVWESCAGSSSDLDIWMLDMQTLMEGGIMLLVAAVNKQVTPQIHYALGKLSTDTASAPNKFTEFCPLKNTAFYSEEYESELLDYKFLLVRRTAYIYNQKVIVAVSVMNDVDEADIIQFGTSGDSILGGALCGNVPVLFSKLHGLVSISSSDMSPHELSSVSFTDLPNTLEVSVPQFSEGGLNITISDKELEKLASNKDTLSRLRAAFIQYVKDRRDLTQCKKIINELIPPGVDPLNDIDSELDVTVINMSRDLIDDFPASDPRWLNETQNPALLTYSSLQILHQLEDKSTALKLYISFLKDVQLWEKFHAVRIHDGIMATPYVLGEHAEKLVAAIALRKLQTSPGGGHAGIIDSAIRLLVDKRDIRDGLTHQDLFYRRVSEIHHFFRALAMRSNELVLSDRQPQEVINILAETNIIIQTVLQDVIEFRQHQAEVFSTTSYLNSSHCVYIPWTSAPGEGGIKDALTRQRDITLKHGVRTTGDIVLKNQLLDHLVNIVDIILDGRKCQVESTRRSGEIDERLLESYEKERYELIHPFVEDKEYERATILAEKYCDFVILIEICDYTDNNERLNQYINKFDEQGFSQILYKWYVSQRKHGKLLGLLQRQENVDGHLESLAEFLEHYPSLSWLSSVHTGNYKKAGETLEKLAEQEYEYMQRKKSMLSFAKLALLASNEHSDTTANEIEKINSQLDLITYQEDLPETVLSAYGLSAEKIRVLTPTEMIQMYISDEFLGASELEFMKALDLLAYIDVEEREELRNTIWCHAVLRDKWTDTVVGSPVDVIQNTIFFKLVELLHIMGVQVEEVLPPVESILNSEKLGSLRESSNFQFLLQVGYEYVTRTMKDTM
ncbi:nuclear pore complex protein Nup133 [Anabrus simplex]|uniref:nuclear pore complex protein Nup133 n=1 Tax=Anabrus simplex TaxID=316456 RepID=UPI0035A33C77